MMAPCIEFPEGMCGKTVHWLLKHTDSALAPAIRDRLAAGEPRLRRCLAFRHKGSLFGLVSFADRADLVFALTPGARP